MIEPERIRLAQGMNVAGLSAIFSSTKRGNARIELVFNDDSRLPVGRTADTAAMRQLARLTRPGAAARLELVFDVPHDGLGCSHLPEPEMGRIERVAS